MVSFLKKHFSKVFFLFLIKMFLFVDSDNSSDDGEEKIMVERYWKREPSSEFKSRTDAEFYS